MNFADYLNLARVRQWYKNLVIFLALFFSGNLFSVELIYFSALGFLALCLVSSGNYILNDLADIKKDQNHPEKKHRPLAAGKIKPISAVFLALLLFLLGLSLSVWLGNSFLILVMIIILLTQAYTFFLKKIVFADILAIATLFVLRAISGAQVINVNVSPWLILCPFFLSLFLSVGKRSADLSFLKTKAGYTRETLKTYTLELTNSLMLISTTLLIISYALYSFLSEHQNLLYSLPFALFVIFRYYYLISQGSLIARHPEQFIRDRSLIIGIMLWLIITTALVYV
ncbi:MAG TPA: UbiA family prenyltransferase [Candidatus Nanoarchaeia archaeon]|nr:UbiA family prenyltransferase [Candidatus Nanoarchaeia archaeon]